MAKRILTPAQKEARKERARRRREERKAAAAAGVPVTKTTRKKKEPKAVEPLPEVLAQVTEATTESDLIAPVKKAKKSRRSRKTVDVPVEPRKVTLFASLDSVKEHQFHRFSDNDDYKGVYYMVKTANGGNLMRGLFCKITSDGRIDPSEYAQLEKTKSETGFIGFVKEDR